MKKAIRPLLRIASEDDMRGDLGAQGRSVLNVREDPSTKSTKQSASEVDFQKRAIVLLSGGLDSTTTLYIAASLGFNVYALSFLYGQRHVIELEKAKKTARSHPSVIEHKIIEFPMQGSSLTDPDAKVPKNQMHELNKIPSTYVPARNTIFLSFALSFAEVVGANDIFIGANVVDYSNYPDCRPEYLAAFEKMARLATAFGVQGNEIKIHAPLIKMSKKEIVEKGIELGVNFSDTISCYDPKPNGASCGFCDSCRFRKVAFEQAGLTDPIVYV